MIITCPNCSTRYSLPQDKIKPGGQKVRCAKCGTVWHQAPDEPEPLALTTEDQVPMPPAPVWAPAAPVEAAPSQVPPNVSPDLPSGPIDNPVVAPTQTGEVAVAEAAAVSRQLPPDNFAQFHFQSRAEEKPTGAGRKWAIAVIVLVVLALAALVVFRQQVQDLTGIQLVSAPAPALPAPAPAPAAPAPAVIAPQPLTLTFEEVESSIEEIDGSRRLMVKGLIVNPADHEQTVPPLAFTMLDKDGKPIDRWTFAAPVRALAPRTTTRFSGQRDTPPTTLHELVPGFDVPENPPPAIEPPAEAGAGAATAPAQPAPAPGPAAATKPPAVPQTQPE